MFLTREEIIQNIKNCGQSMIDNAEQMVGDYKFMTDLTITCYVNERDNAPTINVDTRFIPEKFIERCK